jgi:glycosyltransferase involved in cell wall biosynthesis
MRIAVITPYSDSKIKALDRCRNSVASQTTPCTHLLVGSVPLQLPTDRSMQNLVVPPPHAWSTNSRRAFGSISAITQGFDAIAYLDELCWYEPRHLELLVETVSRENAAIGSSTRTLYAPDGRLLGPCPEIDGDVFVDVNCLLITKPAFIFVSQWFLAPPEQERIADRYLWRALKLSGLKRVHHGIATLNYPTSYRAHLDFFSQCNLGESENLTVERGNRGLSRSNQSAVPPSPPKQNVSACLIVRDEEANLIDCLNCIQALVDEVIVVDTGSTDQTRELARQAGAKVFDFEWVDDFSAARNFAVEQATGAWILWLDADDRIDATNQARLRRIFEYLLAKDQAYLMAQSSPVVANSGRGLHVEHVRLFRNHPNARWSYRLHEQLLPALQKLQFEIVRTDVTIDHHGYADLATLQRKTERNRRILELELLERPDDGFVLFNLGNLHLDAGRLDLGIDFLQRAIQWTHPGASILPKAITLLARGYFQRGQMDRAFEEISNARYRFPDNVELIFEEGVLQMARGRLHEARVCFERVLSAPPATHWVGVDPLIFSLHSRHNLALVYRDLKKPDDAEREWRLAAHQHPNSGIPWLGLLELALSKNDVVTAENLIRQYPGADKYPAVAAVLLARLAIHRKETAQGIRTLEEAVAKAPADSWSKSILREMKRRAQ